MLKSFFLLILFVISQSVFATSCDESIIIRNSESHQINSFLNPAFYTERDISLERSCEVVTAIKQLYSAHPDSNIKIDYYIDWDNGGLSGAYADYDIENGRYIIVVEGGLFLYPNMTKGALAAAVCHELGHIVGGIKSTRLSIDGKEPINKSEGLADYFSSQHCMKKLATMDVLENNNIPRISRIQKICQEDNLCIRILNAGHDLNSSLSNFTTSFDFESDRISTLLALNKGMPSYPDDRCRFDTFISGFFCPEDSKYPCGLNADGTNSNDNLSKFRPPVCFYPN